MIFRESETVELKEIVVDDIKKEIVAFANSAGGVLYIGVADDGSIAGVENPDGTTQQIVNMVRDSIKPDITMFLHYETREIEGKQVIAVEVQRGDRAPLLSGEEGPAPGGGSLSGKARRLCRPPIP